MTTLAGAGEGVQAPAQPPRDGGGRQFPGGGGGGVPLPPPPPGGGGDPQVQRFLPQIFSSVSIGGGAPPRELRALAWYNVKDFGARGDGAAGFFDDVAVQAAEVVAALNGGGIVYYPPGTYRQRTKVSNTAIGVHIVGSGSRATTIFWDPIAAGPVFEFNAGGGQSLWSTSISGFEFQSVDVAFKKEMIKLVDCRRCVVEDVTSQDGFWNGQGSIGLHILGRDLITVDKCWFAADQPLQIDPNPNFAANGLDFATFTRTQFAVQAGVNAYNVEIGDGVTWTNCVWRDCDAARGLGFARWVDTTSPNASQQNEFEGCRMEQAIAGATYSWDLGSTVSQLQGTNFKRCAMGIVINGIKLRRALYTSIDTVTCIAGDMFNLDANCRGFTVKNMLMQAGVTTTGLNLVTGYVDITMVDVANISGDRGDVNFTLVNLFDCQSQRVTSALTANRTVTLSATNAHRGAKFRVTRSGLGAFTLDVGGLKTIPAGTAAFVDVEHDGTAWRLSAYGTL